MVDVMSELLGAYPMTPHSVAHLGLAALGWMAGRSRVLFARVCGVGALILGLLALIILINPLLLMWGMYIPWPETPQVSSGVLLASYFLSFAVGAITAELIGNRAPKKP